MRGLDHKRERLIKQCYPPGHDIEKSPKQSELLYLMYYVTTHRSKIPKVADYLRDKAERYLARANRTGNAMVTLDILHTLVAKCHDDLNVFAPDVLVVTLLASTSEEPLIVQKAALLLAIFNKYDNGLLLATDAEFSKLYSSVIRQFAKLATVSGSQSRELRLAAVKALCSLTDSSALHTETGIRALHTAIGALYANIEVDETGAVFSRFTVDHEHNGAASVLPDDIGYYASVGLKNAYNTASAEQVARVTEAILSQVDHTRPIGWSQALFNATSQWCQVQLRFVILQTIAKHIHEHIDIHDLANQAYFSNLVYGLLSGSVSMVGLSVVDFLRSLLDIQHRLILHNWVSGKNPKTIVQDVNVVLESVKECISTLARHTLYPGQVTDMVSEILVKYASLPDVSQETDSRVVMNDLGDVRGIVTVLPHGEKLPLTCWTSTQWILTRNDPPLVSLYAETFTLFLTKAHMLPQPFTRQGASISRQLCGALVVRTNRVANYIAIYYCLVALVEHLGEKAFSTLPTILQVQETGLRAESGFASAPMNGKANGNNSDSAAGLTPFQGMSLVSVAQAAILAVVRTAQRTRAATVVFDAIQERVTKQVWLPGIVYPASVPVQEAVNIGAASTLSSHGAQKYDARVGGVHVRDLEPTEEEYGWITDSQVALDEPLAHEELQNFKTRARSVTDSVRTGGDQLMLNSRTASFEVDAPKVSDLRRRVSSTISASSAIAPPRASIRASASNRNLAELLSRISVNGDSNRGRVAR